MKVRRNCPTEQKVAYRTEGIALVAARNFTREQIARGEHAEPLYGYPCTGSPKHWHLTRKAKHAGNQNKLLVRVPDDLQVWAQTPRRDAG